MPTAKLKSPRTLNKYGRRWAKGVEETIDFKEYKRMEGDPRFEFGGVKITVEEDPDEVIPPVVTNPKKLTKGRTRTKVSDVAPAKTPAKKSAGVKLVKKPAAAAKPDAIVADGAEDKAEDKPEDQGTADEGENKEG